jgi:hypothetical protein
MFIFQNDWKVLPMAAIIAGLVSFVVGKNVFVNQEGTLTGTFALTCVCIWNGFFNSIQVICRERPIVKREHRSGLHITSYIAAHMIYQAFLCIGQTVITIGICTLADVSFPDKSMLFPFALADFGVTIFLITYSADMMALMVSAVVHSTTTAMTIMPFLLIFQLVFSGGFFSLSGTALQLTDITISKWGLAALCIQGDYNSLPMVSLWNSMVKMKDVEVEGEKPVFEVLNYIETTGRRDEILAESGRQNQNLAYEYSPFNLLKCWMFLIFFALLYAVIATVSLESIDKDKR